jgi:drug/metabolite transporter (DMT)-like permease
VGVTRKLPWQVWAALGTVYLVWGSTYFAIRITVRTLPPVSAASARFLVAGTILIALAAAGGQLRAVSWRGVGLAAVPGVLLGACGNGLVMLGERTVESSVAALIIALAPLLMALMTMGLDRRLASRRALWGLLLGFAGLILLLRPQPGAQIDPRGALTVLGATVAWAAGSVFAGRRPTGMGAAATSGFQMLAAGLALAVAAAAFREPAPVLDAAAVPALWALAYLVVFGSLIGFSAYSWLLSRAPLSLVSTYAYVNPVVAIALGVTFLRESFGVPELLASAVIVGGVGLIVSSPQRAAKEGYSRASEAAPPRPSEDRGGGRGPEPASSRAVR